jgi:hypothetical protein
MSNTDQICREIVATQKAVSIIINVLRDITVNGASFSDINKDLNNATEALLSAIKQSIQPVKNCPTLQEYIAWVTSGPNSFRSNEEIYNFFTERHEA